MDDDRLGPPLFDTNISIDQSLSLPFHNVGETTRTFISRLVSAPCADILDASFDYAQPTRRA